MTINCKLLAKRQELKSNVVDWVPLKKYIITIYRKVSYLWHLTAADSLIDMYLYAIKGLVGVLISTADYRKKLRSYVSYPGNFIITGRLNFSKPAT